MIFADASALLAIMSQEDDALQLAERLDTDRDRLCSAVVIWETVAGLCRSYEFPVQGARLYVRDFLDEFRFLVVGIGSRESEIATDAYARYGRGRHPAALNMGDCFTYACAKSHGARLLYLGSDFAHTELA